MIAEKDKEETKYMLPSKMSKELRDDPEVSLKLSQLDQAAKFYMAFDMVTMQSTLSHELDNQIGKVR